MRTWCVVYYTSHICADALIQLRICKLHKVLGDSPCGYLTTGWCGCIHIGKTGQWYYEHHSWVWTLKHRVNNKYTSDSSTLLLVGLITLWELSTGLLYLCTTILHTIQCTLTIQFLWVSPTFTCLWQHWWNGHTLLTCWWHFGDMCCKVVLMLTENIPQRWKKTDKNKHTNKTIQC